ncbi:MAG: 5'-3' exonuclease H3TH domain-containing protein [Dehalococcoidia bacterium]
MRYPARVQVHLIDGTYELFRHYFVLPSHKDEDGIEVAAVRGVVRSMLAMLEEGATHLGVATDHVVESFRNDMWPGYKTGAGVAPELLAQFPILEEALAALGVVVWPMKKYEADDALATAAAQAASYAERVLICTPDKDLAQCVVDGRVVQFDRRARKLIDAAGVVAKFGVKPASIPDYLALVGDSADGFPGLPGWGAKAAAATLARFGHIESVPDDPAAWGVPVRGASRLASTLAEQRDRALLFKDLATLRRDAKIDASAEALRWSGPRRTFKSVAARIGAPSLYDGATALAAKRA